MQTDKKKASVNSETSACSVDEASEEGT